MGKVKLYIPISKDNCLYAKDGKMDWLPPHELVIDEKDHLGYHAFTISVTYIFMGSKQYQGMLKFGDWGFKDQTTYVFTSNKSLVRENSDKINFVHDDPGKFMSTFKDGSGDAWLMGGGKLITSFDKLKLIDEVVLTIIPKDIDGIKLDISYDNYNLKESKDCVNNICMKYYSKK